MPGKKAMRIGLKRAYDAPSASDGYRVLVDRIWPRGVSKARLRLDDWVKDLAPSTALRQWFNHEPAKWDAFRERYFRELDERPDAVESLRSRLRGQSVTLVFGARDTQHNDAVALKEYLERSAG